MQTKVEVKDVEASTDQEAGQEGIEIRVVLKGKKREDKQGREEERGTNQ